jgi:hypothetical protein
MITAMVEAGDVAGAQQVILAELQKEFGGSARALADPAIQLQNAWGDFKEEVGKAIVPLLNELAQKLLPYVTEAIARLPEVIDWFVETAVPAFKQVMAVIGAFVNFVRPIFESFGKVIQENGVDRFEYFRQWIDTNLPMIRHIVEVTLKLLTDFWREHGDVILTVITNKLKALFLIFDTVLKTILDIVQFALQVITGDWEAAGETLIGIVQRIWDTIKAIFSLEIENVKAIVQDINWQGIGESMVDGMKSGIEIRSGSLADAAVTAASGAIDRVRNFLGARSPSRLTEEEIGKPFAQGISVGIGRELSALQQSIGAGMGNLVSSMGPQPAMASAGSSYTINVSIGGGGGYDAGRAAGRGILDELRSRGLR